MGAREFLRECAGSRIPTECVPISLLSVEGHPRTGAENLPYARMLAERIAELPPIVVYRPTYQVLDGVHRLRAAALAGQESIGVRFFDGSEADAFVLAVQANIRHGLPLRHADRAAAAARIVTSHPQWSDRAIAAVAGLAPSTVGAIRRRAAEQPEQLHTRRGLDGRSRPCDLVAGRQMASDLICDNPTASLREIAREAGISPGTVRDVRERLRRGEDILPPRLRARRPDGDARAEDANHLLRDPVLALQQLRRDPSLRFTEEGRQLLRLLHLNAVGPEQWDRLVDSIPPHCADMAVELARTCAENWREFAESLERRCTQSSIGDVAGRG
nr:winged helix-turn-helix transcriptional regulator [Actinokineospora enzanensis]